MFLHVVEPGSGEEIILVLGLGLALAVAGGEASGCYERGVVVLSRENTKVIKLIHSPRQDRHLQQPRDLRQGEVTRRAEYDRSVGVRQRVYEGLNNKSRKIDIDIAFIASMHLIC